MKSLNDSDRDQWLENVKNVLTMVSKCIDGELYMEAAQLVFAVITKLISLITKNVYEILFLYLQTVCQEIKSDIQPNVIRQLATAGALLIEEYKEKNIQSTLTNGNILLLIYCIN